MSPVGLVEVGAGAGGGSLLWSLMEYLFHRFTMHRTNGRGILTREHLTHHAQASWRWSPLFILNWSGLLLLGFAACFPIGRATISHRFGLGLSGGWAVGCLFYECAHARAHVGPPTNRYGVWLRHHHFHHHFGHPSTNFGVTSPLWDHVFGTFEQPGQVRIPRRLAMSWLLDDSGAVLREHADRYVLVGTAVGDDGRSRVLELARSLAGISPVE